MSAARPARGFTLIEVLMAGTTLVIILSIANQFFTAALASVSVVTGQATVQTQLSLAMRTVVSDVRQAYVRQFGSCVTFAGTFTSDNDTLCLRLPVINADGTAHPSLFDLVVLDLNPATGELRRILTGSNPINNSDRIIAHYLQAPADGVVFSSPASNLIKCSLRTNRIEKGWTHISDLTYQARFRNAS